MRIEIHPNHRRVSAQQVRAVLDNARQYTIPEWAAFFEVHAQTVKAWRAKGFFIGLWSAPSEQQWNTVTGEAVRSVWKLLDVLEGKSDR